MWDKCISNGEYEDVFGGGGSGYCRRAGWFDLETPTNLFFEEQV